MNSPEAAIVVPQGTPALTMLRTLGGIATLSGLLVVLAFKLTLPRIEANQRRATEQAIFRVLPQAVTQRGFVITSEGLKPASPEVNGEMIYAGYDAAGAFQGVALPAAAQGYGDLIKVLYAYRPACECIIGARVLKMAETPGFGDRMGYDPDFLNNFKALDARLDSAGAALLHPIVAVKHGSKTEPWQIDALSGATISSRGMAKALDSSAQRLLPLVRHQLTILQAAERIITNQAPRTSAGG